MKGLLTIAYMASIMLFASCSEQVVEKEKETTFTATSPIQTDTTV